VPVRPNLNPPIVASHPDLLFTQTEPNFGTAALIDNGTLYAFGCGTPLTTDKSCFLARAAPASAQTPGAWSYYENGTWNSNIGDATPVFTGGSIMSVSWNAYLSRYVAIYSLPLSNAVMMRTAPAVEGPWSAQTQLFTAMAPAGTYVDYDAHAHSEYDIDGGQTIFITYSRATGEFTSEIRLVEVQFR
jgi:hypothetical protein